MERLTGKDKYSIFGFCIGSGHSIGEAVTKLAHYEDLEEQGLLIKLPCEPNKYVWCANAFGTYKVVYPSKASIIQDMELGYGIGYTKEEAEAKLKELQRK